jgi:hypothetical protein
MTGPILFEITAADSHQQIILPVIRRLRECGIPAIVYSDCELLRTASDPGPLEREDIPFVRALSEPLPLPMREWEPAARAFRRKIPEELARVRPALLVVLNDRNFPPNAYVQEARRLRIPTLLIQESLRKDLFQKPPLVKLIGRRLRLLRSGIEEGLRHFGQGGCDAVAAWGASSREYFLRVGVPEERIHITGNPRFDQLADADFRASARRIRAEWSVPDEGFLLAFLSSPVERMQIISKEEKRAALARWIDWIGRMREDAEWKDLRLAFKLHRSEDPSILQSLLAERGAAGWAHVADTELYPLLQASQAAAMFSTTAGLEAALLSVPVGIMELSRPLDDWDFIGRGVAAGIRTEQDLRAFLRSARSGGAIGKRGARAAEHYLSNLGHAAEAVAGLAARMAGYAGAGDAE